MRKPKKPRIERVAPEDLAGAVLKLLQTSPYTIAELARQTRYTASAVRDRLFELKECGHVHRRSVQDRPMGGLQYVWHVGLVTDDIPCAIERPRAVVPPQAVAPQDVVTGRDPLVSALFGPANQSQGT